MGRGVHRRVEMKKLVVGVTGEMSSGKGTVTSHLYEWYPNVESFRYSDSLREFYAWLRKDFIPPSMTFVNVDASTTQLQQLSTAVRKIFGENSLERAIMARIKRALSSDKFVVVEGIRRLVDITVLECDESIDFKLVYVDAVPETRYQRHVLRNEKPGDSELSLGEFLHLGNAESEAQIRLLIPHADFVLHNNGTREEFATTLRAVLNEWTV